MLPLPEARGGADNYPLSRTSHDREFYLTEIEIKRGPNNIVSIIVLLRWLGAK